MLTSHRSMAELFQVTAARNPDATALRTADGTQTFTWSEYAAKVRTLAAGLAALGVERGDNLALMLTNRPEMHLFDAAAFHLGATPFSIYNTSSPEQIEFLFNFGEPKVVVTETQFLEVLWGVKNSTSVKHYVNVDGDTPGTLTLSAVEKNADPAFDFEGAWARVGPDDVLTLIFTSGTTGDPKAVQILHSNMLAELEATNSIMNAGPGDRIISFLPSAHIADRWASHYLQIAAGNELTCLADRTDLLATLTSVRPTLFGGVPQMWQKIHAAIDAQIEAEPDENRRAGIKRAIDFAINYVTQRDRGEATEEMVEQYAAIDAQVFRPLREKLGLENARVVQSGAAPIPLTTLIYFNAIGIPLTDVWGMSELSCLAAMPPLSGARFGTIGKVVPGVEMTVADDGELLVRGPIVMAGYLGRADLTGEVIDDDGWMHTGDIGSIDDDGWVRIVDRKKELIINSSGKNMSPANIESAIKAGTPLIGQVVAIGNDRPYNVALIVLDPESAAMYAARRQISPEAPVLAADAHVQTLVEDAVQAGNSRLSRTEQVKKYVILPEYWEPGTATLTHTMKLRRRPIDEIYAQAIADLYASDR